MRASFVSFIQNRYLLADLAYAMLDHGQVEAASEAEVRSIVSSLLADPDKSYGFDTVDEFLQRVCPTELLLLRNGVIRWRSARTQAYLAAPVLYARYRQRDLDDEQEAAAWLQGKAKLTQWHEPISVMGYYIKEAEHACQLAELLMATTPFLAARYREQLEEGFFEIPWHERMFLGEIAWPLGEFSFWKEALGDRDPDTRRQAALVLGIARVAEAGGLLLDRLSDEDDQVRARAAWAIGRLATVDAGERLFSLLDDASRRVRFQARRALALIRRERETEPVLQFQTEEAERADMTILLSDDEPQMLELYELILGRKGYKVLHALGGEQTLELARCERPDLIITDLMNTHMMGMKLVAELRSAAITRDIPIVMASAQPLFWFSGSFHWLGFFEGADAYLQQPFGPQELLSLVDEILFG